MPAALGAYLAGIAINPTGDVYVADVSANRIRRVQASAPFLIEPPAMLFSYPLGATPEKRQLSLSAQDGGQALAAALHQ
jgi:streptogramin lyase